MRLEVEHTIENRSDDRVARTPTGWASASPTVLTRWDDDGQIAGEPLTIDSPVSGPLVSLSDTELGWGPLLVVDGRARWAAVDVLGVATSDLGVIATEPFRLKAAAVGAGSRQVVVALERTTPKRRSRVAVVDMTVARSVATLSDGDAIASAVGWGRGPLMVGYQDRIALHDPVQGASELRLEVTDVVRSMAAVTDQITAAGTHRGYVNLFATQLASRLARWDAHDGPVTAIDGAGYDRLWASAGQDGFVHVWSVDEPRARIQLGGAVEAIAWVAGDRIVAKAGGNQGRLVTLRLTDG